MTSRTRWRLVSAVLAPAILSCSDSSGPPRIGPPAVVSVVSGAAQQGTVGADLAQPIVVLVTDAEHHPISGQRVDFAIAAGGGSVAPASTLTDAEGRASTAWRLGTGAGSAQSLEARVLDNAGVLLLQQIVSATAQPGAPSLVTAVQGAPESAFLGAELPEVSVRLADEHGNVVPAAAVQWTVESGGGSAVAVAAQSDVQGIARARWTLGMRLDSEHVLRASTATGSARFAVTPTLPATATIVKLAGDAQADTVARALSDSLAVKVALADGRAVQGAAIVWSVTSGDGSLAAGSARTAVDGTARAKWTLDTKAGPNRAAATLSQLGAVQFGATGTNDRAEAVAKVAGDGATGMYGALLADTLVARAEDRFGNPVAGAWLRWEVQDHTGLANLRLQSDAQGLSRSRARLLDPNTSTPPEPGAVRPLVFIDGGDRAKGARFELRAKGWKSISSLSSHFGACGISELGDAYCWGLNRNGYIGNPIVPIHVDTATAPIRVAGLPKMASLAAGDEFVCGLPVEGPLTYCWGENGGFQLGNTSPGNNNLVTTVNTAQRFVELAAGDDHACGRTAVGELWCWGLNHNGQLGTGTTLGTQTCEFSWGCEPAPRKVPGTTVWKRVVAGGWGTCAIDADDQAWCWGRTAARPDEPVNLSDGSAAFATPRMVGAAVRFRDVAAGFEHACGLGTDGRVYCWGRNDRGQIGTGATSTAYVPVPVIVPVPGTVVDVTAKYEHTCATTASREVYCWGSNTHAQIAGGASPSAPTSSAPGFEVARSEASYLETCVLTTSAALYCRGYVYPFFAPRWKEFLPVAPAREP